MESLMDIYYFALDIFDLLKNTLTDLVNWLITPINNSGIMNAVYEAVREVFNLIGISMPTKIVPIYFIFGGGLVIVLTIGLISFITNLVT